MFKIVGAGLGAATCFFHGVRGSTRPDRRALSLQPNQVVEELAAAAERPIEAQLTGATLQAYRAGREDDRSTTA